MQKKKLAVVAVGGNALIRSNDEVSLDQQYDAVVETARHVADLIAAGWQVVLTHGNGPQVGFILRRSELASAQVPTVPLEYAVGDTQGAIGFMFQNALGNELRRSGLAHTKVIALVTQTLIDRCDPAFTHPDKPIGAHMSQPIAEQLAAEQGWQIAEDAGRGWRRVVASPAPLGIVETPTIRALLEQDALVIACGGGGIPVVRKRRFPAGRPSGHRQGPRLCPARYRAASRHAVNPDRCRTGCHPFRNTRTTLARDPEPCRGNSTASRRPLRCR